jgi:cellulose synthase operon protein C
MSAHLNAHFSAKARRRRAVAFGVVLGALTLGGPLAPGRGTGLISSAQAASGSYAPYSESELHAAESPEEAKIRSLRDQEIAQLRSVLGRRQPKNRMAELYYRLAEIYLEAYHQAYVLEGRVHEKRLAQGQSSSVIDHAHSRPYLLMGITASKEILATGIQYEQMDHVYYFLGFNYGQLGERKESVKYFAELVRRYPSSVFAPEASRELGDDAYDRLQFRQAQEYYEQAIQKAPADSQPLLYHKLAWAYYRTKNFDQAISSLKSAISLAQKSGEKYLNLHEEALRDMAVFMTESGHVEDAISYFQQTVPDPNFYSKTLEHLGKQYERNVEPAKATQVYESLLRTNPDSEAAFRVLVKLVDLDLRRLRYKEALVRIQSAKITTSFPSFKEEETQTAAQNLRAMVRRTATEHHEIFRKKSDRAALAVAEQYYQVYLKKFLAQDDPRKETPEIQMYLAEVERELGKSQEASHLYRLVVTGGDKRYAKEAAALWTTSLADAVKKAGAGGSGNKGGVEPSALEKEYVEAADDLQGTLGDTAEGREAALKAAQILGGYSQTREDSIVRVKKIIDRAPSSPQANMAARLWLQLTVESSQNSKADSELKDLAHELRGNAALMAADNETSKGKLHAALAEQDTRLKIAVIAVQEKDKDYAAAAQGYEAFAAEEVAAKDQGTAEKAYANAVSSYLKAGDWVSLERVLANWLKHYPKSAKASDTYKASATHALIEGKFDVSARFFETMGSESGGAGEADSLATAARIYEGTGDLPRAQTDYARYVQLTRGAPTAERAEVLLNLARIYEEQKMDSEAVQTYRDCMTVSAAWEARCGSKLAELLFHLKNDEEAVGILKKIASQGGGYTTAANAAASKAHHKGKAGKPSPEPAQSNTSGPLSPYVGYARFRLADLLEQSQRFAPLELPDTRLKEGINQRVQFLEPLSRAYDSAVEAGGPWAIAALDRLARWAAHFADEVDHITPPESISSNAKSVAQFRQSLGGISAPLRKKAMDSWANAYRKALDSEALSSAVPEMADHMAALGASAPQRAQGFHGRFRVAGIPLDGGKDGVDTALERTRERLLKNSQDALAWVDYGNLLSGSGKPLLARIAYDRAVALDPKNPIALNNKAVTLVLGKDSYGGALEEDWLSAGEASSFFTEALRKDEFFVPAKLNRALLLNYYRLFEKAKPLLEQILVRNDQADVHDALGVALQGLGDPTRATAEFAKADEEGLKSTRFSELYHRAAREAVSKEFKKCVSTLDDLSPSELELAAFERQAVDDLKRSCTAWIQEKN